MSVGEVAVVGAGVVGLASALFLARRGHHVVVLDRDGRPPPGPPEEAFEQWERRGVPHAAHSHVFKARSARVLRSEAPDVLDRLEAGGVARLDREFGEGFEDDVAHASRRLVYEAIVRSAVEAEPRIELRTGVNVTGLLVDRSQTVPTVVGLRTATGERVLAHLVVDCGGRQSAARRWFAGLNLSGPSERFYPCGLHYFARHYRLLPGTTYPTFRLPFGSMTPYGPFICFGGDNATFSLAVALSNRDPCRTALRGEETFGRVFAEIPDFADWLAVAEPISEVHVMAGLANRRRSLLSEGHPVVSGYTLVGDASIYTNATFGQGISLGLWQAQRLALLSERHDISSHGLVQDLEDWTNRVLGQWFAEQVAVDAAMTKTMQDGIQGAAMPEPSRGRRAYAAVATLAGKGDLDAAHAKARVDHLLSPPTSLLEDAALARKVQRLLDANPAFGGNTGGLPRTDFEALAK